MRTSEKRHWEDFWEAKSDMDEVYPSVTDVASELTAFTGVEGKRVLEVGAGTGRDSVELAVQGATVFVLDYADNSLAIVKKLKDRGAANIHLIKADAFRMPFKDDTLDVVFHQGLLEHFRNPEDLLAENIRVTKPAGLLLVDVPQKYHPYTILKHSLILINKWFAGWETQFSIRELKGMIERHGCKVVHEYGNWMYPSMLYRMFREALLKLHIVKLPRFPKPWPILGALRRGFRNWFKKKHPAMYTFNAIGVVARKDKREG